MEDKERVTQETEAMTEELKAEGAATEDVKETGQQADSQEEIAELNNRLLRMQADFDNYRRRTNAERASLASFVTANVVEQFLKILDNFERAEASAATGVDTEGIIKGLAQIRKQFDETLKTLKVEEIPALNVKFDANYHEAIMRGHNPEVEDDVVDMVLEKGYKLGDRVIRHSKVRVNSNEE